MVSSGRIETLDGGPVGLLKGVGLRGSTRSATSSAARLEMASGSGGTAAGNTIELGQRRRLDVRSVSMEVHTTGSRPRARTCAPAGEATNAASHRSHVQGEVSADRGQGFQRGRGDARR